MSCCLKPVSGNTKHDDSSRGEAKKYWFSMLLYQGRSFTNPLGKPLSVLLVARAVGRY